NPHVDDYSTRLDHIAGDKFRFADRHYQNVSSTADLRHVRRAAVHQSYSGIAWIGVAGHQDGHRRAHDVAATNNHTVFAAGFDVVALEQLHHTVRSGGDRKSTRLNSSHVKNSYAVFCLKKKTK